MTGFSVVTMVREDPAIIERFASHHEALGAEAVFICFDGYEPAAGLAGPKRHLVAIDDGFWQARGRSRPEALEDRQHAAYLHCLGLCGSDWLLVADCDEFVLPAGDIGKFLEAIPEEIDAVRLRTAEAVWGPGDRLADMWGSTHFRLAFESRLAWFLLALPLYGSAARFLRRGLIGHVGGKQFVRTGRGIDEIRAHVAFRGGTMVTRWADGLGAACRGFAIGHFDAIGLARWRSKWEKRFSGVGRVDYMRPARGRQVKAIVKAFTEGGSAPERLFCRFYRVAGWRYKLLEALGLAFRRDLFGISRDQDHRNGH